MKYKVGDKVRIKSFDWYYENKDRIDEVDCGNATFISEMVTFCKKIVTISSVLPTLEVYHIKEDGGRYHWTDEMFEELAEEGNNMNNIDKLKRISTPAEENWFEIAKEWEREDKEMDKLKHEAILPEGYVFKDENGNIINATKIVMEKKKKIYPKTYEECCKILDFCGEYFFTTYEDGIHFPGEDNNIYQILKSTSILTKLLICRDAYWKLAGEKMGLGKPWEPDWKSPSHDSYPAITRCDGRVIKTTIYTHDCPLAFPTSEMRDTFYENFKKLIENCKELL